MSQPKDLPLSEAMKKNIEWLRHKFYVNGVDTIRVGNRAWEGGEMRSNQAEALERRGYLKITYVEWYVARDGRDSHREIRKADFHPDGPNAITKLADLVEKGGR